MNLNDLIDRSQLGRVDSCGGYQFHLQALAKEQYSHKVSLMVIQGRPTNVRAIWARFHESDLSYSLSRYPGKVYLQPNPVAKLPQGDLEICIIHRGFVPGQVAADPELQRFTFGPPHFFPMFQAMFNIPALPHWEYWLWEMAKDERLVRSLVGLNTRAWIISNSNPQTWLEHMATDEWRQHWTYEPDPEVNHE
ncbi:MAG: hypothetical protein KKB13_11015 [Chloroflexi bacterium]|nr:hypothetical protein [Chloroflexota bacterium]